MKIRQRGDSSYILIIVIVLLLIIGVGGYYIYQRPANPEHPNIQLTSSSSPSGSSGDVTQVKEYSNTKLGFRFNYDGTSEITEKENNVQGSNLIYEVIVSNPKFGDNTPYLELAVNKDSSECPLKSTDVKNPKISQMAVDGKQSELIEGESAYSIYRKSLCIEDNNNNLFWFVSDYPVNSPDDVKAQRSKLFDQILVSLKFAPSGQAESINFFPEGQSCGRNAGAGGDAKCASGLVCKYPTKQDEEIGIGVCTKP